MTTMTNRPLALDQLLLDPNNFRFRGNVDVPDIASARFAEAMVQDAALQRHKSDGLQDLRASIVENDYLEVDRVVVKLWPESAESDPRYVVIEGNRRVATLKLLRAEEKAGVELSDDLKATFQAVPCVVLDDPDRATELAIMGVRHVGGVKEWGGYQAAAIVAVLKDEEGLNTSQVAARLGLSAQEVNRRYRAYTAVEQMRADEEYGEYVTSDHYALLHEAVANRAIREYFGWDSNTETFADEDRAREFYRLITPSSNENNQTTEPKIRRYTEVRALKGLLGNATAMESLADLDAPLQTALAIVEASNERKNWRTKVNDAVTAIGAIGLNDLPNLDDQDRARLKELADRLNLLVQQISAISATAPTHADP